MSNCCECYKLFKAEDTVKEEVGGIKQELIDNDGTSAVFCYICYLAQYFLLLLITQLDIGRSPLPCQKCKTLPPVLP